MKQHAIWVLFAAVLLTVVLFVLAGGNHAHAFENDSVICVSDLNDDGYADSDEIGYCVETAQGDLCPIEAQDCIAGSGVEITCPDGTVLDSGENKCISVPGISCNSGLEYIEEHNVCAVNATCDGGSALNTGTDKCEIAAVPDCPSGTELYNWNGTYICKKSPNCPSGSSYNCSTKRCERVVSYSCPSGTTLRYVSGQYRCYRSATPSYCFTDGGENGGCSERSEGIMPATVRCVNNTPPAGATLVGWAQWEPRRNECAWEEHWSSGSSCPSGYTKSGNECYIAATTTCPSGYTRSGSVCYRASTCDSGFAYNANIPSSQCSGGGSCYVNSNLCLPGYTHSSGVCAKNPSCSSGTYDVNIDKCIIPVSVDCPEETVYNEIDKICESYPSCPPGSVYNSERNICTRIPQCASEDTYNCSVAACEQIADYTCPSGTTLRKVGSSYRCYRSGTISFCYTKSTTTEITGTGLEVGSWIWDNCTYTSECFNPAPGLTPDTCFELPHWGLSQSQCANVEYKTKCGNEKCASPSWEAATNTTCKPSSSYGTQTGSQCTGNTKPAGATQVGAKYTPRTNPAEIDFLTTSATGYCDRYSYWGATTCPSGYTPDGNECYIAATPTCPSGYTRSGSVCLISPDCSVIDPDWEFDASITQDGCKGVCFAQGVQSICPYGEEFLCVTNPSTGNKQCSPNPCFVFIEGTDDEDTQEGVNDKTEKSFEEDGTCDGNILFFNGYDYRCREAGYKTQWHNCCKTSSSLDTICNDRERTLAPMRASGQCHEIGSYCAKKIKLTGTCIQRVKTFCCFNSEFGLIVQTQGRPLLADGPPWGVPKAPNCTGLSPSEFEMLDFDRMDFSGMYDNVTYPDMNTLSQGAEDKIHEFYER